MRGWDRREYTAAAGTRWHAAVLGPDHAPEVVCVHGLGCSHRHWLRYAQVLAPQARTVAVDLPGFGRTRGPGHALDVRQLSRALADWLRATGRGPVPLVANSTGCQVVVDLAVHAPELLGPVLLNGPTFDRHARTPWRQVGRLLRNPRGESPTLWWFTAASYLNCGLSTALHTFRYALHDPVERKLRHLRTPVLVARGDRDPIAPRAWVDEIAALLPDGRATHVPGGAHTLNHSAPAELARLTRTLLTGWPADPSSVSPEGRAVAPP